MASFIFPAKQVCVPECSDEGKMSCAVTLSVVIPWTRCDECVFTNIYEDDTSFAFRSL